jgi:hypothetical protein
MLRHWRTPRRGTATCCDGCGSVRDARCRSDAPVERATTHALGVRVGLR